MNNNFLTDQVLLYDVDPWNKLGFGVPNFGDNVKTVNRVLHALADTMSKAQLFIMTHIDAARVRPPSRNTIERLGKATNEIKRRLLSRQVPYNENRVEEQHANPVPQPWLIRPAPYFSGPTVRNAWLSEFNHYVMIALTNLYQHSENDLHLTINEAAGDIWQHVSLIEKLLAVELLRLDPSLLTQEFVFTQAHYEGYNPTEITLRTEAIDTPADPRSRFTEDDLKPLVQGIPANLIVPNLSRYPVDRIGDNWGGSENDPIRESIPGPGSLDPVI